MATPRAAGMPIDTRVRSDTGDLIAVKRDHSGRGWAVIGLGRFYDGEIDAWMDAGAEVLRVGDGGGY